MSLMNLIKDPLPGLELDGRYRVISRLGAGSVSDVYLGRQAALGDRTVAIRVLKELLARPGADGGIHQRRFLVEAQLFPLLKHPCFARLHDVGYTPTEPPRPYMIMEYLEGDRLADRVSQGPLPWQEVAFLGLALASALEELHGLGVVLRDLSPGNVILEEIPGLGELPKLFDFSHAVADSIPELGTGQEDELFVGSAPFSAPELASGRGGPTADLFSLGAILYFALSGQPPWSGRTWPKGFQGLLPETPLGRHVKGLPGPLEDLISACLSPNPKRRPQKAMEVCERLLVLLEKRGDQGGPLGLLSALFRPRGERPDSR